MSIQLIHCCVPTRQTENNILATLLSGEHYFWVFWGVKFSHKFTIWSDSTSHSFLSITHSFSHLPIHPGIGSPELTVVYSANILYPGPWNSISLLLAFEQLQSFSVWYGMNTDKLQLCFALIFFKKKRVRYRCSGAKGKLSWLCS